MIETCNSCQSLVIAQRTHAFGTCVISGEHKYRWEKACAAYRALYHPQLKEGTMFKIHKVCRFESAHILPGHPKCGLLHGHSYKVEVSVEATKLNKDGFVIDFGIISDICKKYDHSGRVIEMSAEQLANRILDQIYNHVWGEELQSIVVRVWETETAWAEASYYPTIIEGETIAWPDKETFHREMMNCPRRRQPPTRYDEHELGTHARTITP